MTDIIDQLEKKPISRADFLKGSGALVVTFSIPLGLASPADARVKHPNLYTTPVPTQLDSWLAIKPDGKVTVFTGRNDSGQHKQTSFAQFIADELDVRFEDISILMSDTSLTPDQGPSSASDGLMNGSRPLRRAAAEARLKLLELAAAKFGVPVAQLSVSEGVVTVKGDASKRVTYGELIGNQRFNVALGVVRDNRLGPERSVDVRGRAQLKSPSEFKVVGKSIPQTTIPAKVRGTYPRAHTVRVPGMVHGRLVMPPTYGAHLVSVDGFKKKIKGIIKVVVKGDFVGVVAETEWAAIQGAENLKTTWTEAAELPGSGALYSSMRAAKPTSKRTLIDSGNAPTAIAGAAKSLQADYHYPIQNHGPIAPSCAVVDVRPDQVTVWSHSQAPFHSAHSVADVLGIAHDKVRLIWVESSGLYGRADPDDAPPAAALLSQAVGKPVRLVWTRQQEHGWGPVAPASTFSLRAGLDASGKIVGWDHEEWSYGYFTYGQELALLQVKKADPQQVFNAALFQRPPYSIANVRAVGTSVPPVLRGLYMRSPGTIQYAFAAEQFMDELAAASGQDPIEFRLRHATDKRLIAVLEAARDASGWQKRTFPNNAKGTKPRVVTGRGIAVVANQQQTYVATVAEIEVDRVTGKVRAKRMVVAVDPGIVVNPDGINAQIEGATLYGLSRVLKEQVIFDKKKVLTPDWSGYDILRFTETPPVKIALVDRKDLEPGGIGEPPNTVVPGAVGNAFFDATGVRMRQLPLTPARVKAALKA
jgi:nicotinate dehydrogenase subunit B